MLFKILLVAGVLGMAAAYFLGRNGTMGVAPGEPEYVAGFLVMIGGVMSMVVAVTGLLGLIFRSW